jgi:Outer membrane lipoprotein-sorting protein
MKQVLFLIVFLVPSFLIFAQKDVKAKDLLDKSSETYEQAGGIEAGFTLNIKDVTNKMSEVFDGFILLSADKFFIETPDYALFFDGRTQWVYDKEFDEVNISEPDVKEVQTLNPSSVYIMYKNGYNYKYLGEKTDIKMRKVEEVELTSPDKKNDINRIVAQFDKTTLMPLMFHLYFTSGMENIIYINQYKTNQIIADSVFSFDKKKYPDVEIIDLR